MAARDRYTIEMVCPECERKAVLSISENDYPFMRSADRTIDSVTDGFFAELDRESKLQVTCVCGNKLRH